MYYVLEFGKVGEGWQITGPFDEIDTAEAFGKKTAAHRFRNFEVIQLEAPENCQGFDGTGDVIVITGNPIDGFGYYGPFVDHECFEDWSDDLEDSWWSYNVRVPF